MTRKDMATTGQGQQPQAPATNAAAMDFPRLLEASKGEIARVLPEGVNVERVCRMALTAYRMNTDIRDCTPQSILASVMKAAELGLEPDGGLRHAYLIAIRDNKKGIKECHLWISYFGILELARRSGFFRSIEARTVGEHDEFAVLYDPRPVMRHVPDLKRPGAQIGAYAYAVLASNEVVFEWMNFEDIERIRKGSRQPNGIPWSEHWGEQAKKTVIKRFLKRQPKSVEIAKAIDLDNMGERADTAIAPQFRESHGMAPALTRSAGLAQRLRGGSEPEVEALVAEAIPAADLDEPDVYVSEGGAAN